MYMCMYIIHVGCLSQSFYQAHPSSWWLWLYSAWQAVSPPTWGIVTAGYCWNSVPLPQDTHSRPKEDIPLHLSGSWGQGGKHDGNSKPWIRPISKWVLLCWLAIYMHIYISTSKQFSCGIVHAILIYHKPTMSTELSNCMYCTVMYSLITPLFSMHVHVVLKTARNAEPRYCLLILYMYACTWWHAIIWTLNHNFPLYMCMLGGVGSEVSFSILITIILL